LRPAWATYKLETCLGYLRKLCQKKGEKKKRGREEERGKERKGTRRKKGGKRQKKNSWLQ
jgi:hypothetical protein